MDTSTALRAARPHAAGFECHKPKDITSTHRGTKVKLVMAVFSIAQTIALSGITASADR
jgi:hypothetical protein